MARKVFGYTDIHWSDRDEQALEVAMKAQRLFKPDISVIGGDLINAGPFSRHPKTKIDADEEYDLITTELDPANQFLNYVQKHTRHHTFMLEGNHDEWVERWIVRTDAHGRFGSLLPSRYFTSNRKKFSYIPFTKLDGDRRGALQLTPQLLVVHGWATPKYAAQRHIELAKPYSIIYHHTHRYDNRIVPMYDGKLCEGMNAGCLCKKSPIYAHNGSPTEWVHGFWVAYLGSNSHTLYPVPIHESGFAVMPDGKEVKV